MKRSKFYSEHKTPIFTILLILILVASYYYQTQFLDEETLRSYMTHTHHLFEGNFTTVFTSLFFHASLIHLATNCIALFIFGRNVEKHVGIGIVPLFIFCGIIANVLSNSIAYAFGGDYFSLGASSGIAGIIMFAILFEPFSIFTFVGWGLIYLDVIGVFKESTTNHLAHIGGYVALIVMFFFLEYNKKEKLKKGFFINIGMLIGLYLIIEFVVPIVKLGIGSS